jgi:hypothetical protein
MSSAANWVILEKSGRWAAALRVAIARRSEAHGLARIPKRIYEARSEADLKSALRDRCPILALAEARLDNLAAILHILADERRFNVPIAALMDDSLTTNSSIGRGENPSTFAAADALREAGALAVIQTSRQIASVFDFVELRTSQCSDTTSPPIDQQLLTDWAWAALPWQDD